MISNISKITNCCRHLFSKKISRGYFTLIAASLTSIIFLSFIGSGTVDTRGIQGGNSISTEDTTIKKQASTPSDYPFIFKNDESESGLLPAVGRIMGHGAAWGDINGDGWIDLYVASFFEEDSKLSMLFTNKKGKFKLDKQKALQIASRPTGVIFADLDNDGDLDLYIGSMPKPKENLVGNTLFENNGKGIFSNISKGNAACPDSFGGRSVTVLDYDGDGLLDLLAGEDPVIGYNGSKTKSSRLFRNKGGLQFEDVSGKIGLSKGYPGYGVAAADVNNDSWPDFFLAANNGGSILFLNEKNGTFREWSASKEIFDWKGSGGDKMVCGVSFNDLNRDGLLDMVLGPHFVMPAQNQQPLRLFLNKEISGGDPKFEEVTEIAGLPPQPMKSPHVEIQDFDNDGWPDIYTSIIRFDDGKSFPTIYKHLGLKENIPHFQNNIVNDFPTEEDKKIMKSKDFWDKMLKDKKIIYMAPGPSGDYDNDGKLDIFLASWWVEAPSRLLHNETPGGNWIQVTVAGNPKVNRMGVGSRINIYRAGNTHEASSLLGSQEISIGFGYASGHQAMVHFGLGKEKAVDIQVILPNGNGIVWKKNVKANRRINIK